MRFCIKITFPLFVISMISPFQAFAEIDELLLNLSRNGEHAIRWYNVEQKPEWIGGQKPAYNWSKKLHSIHLKPNDDTVVFLPAFEHLRGSLINTTKNLQQETFEKLEFSVSDGTGLFHVIPSLVDREYNSVIASPRLFKPALVRISLSADANYSVDIALFTSRRISHKPILSYRNLIPPQNLKKVSLSSNAQGGSTLFWHQHASELAKIKVSGPARIKLETRLLYHQGQAEDINYQTYRIETSIDNTPHRVLEASTSVNFIDNVKVDGQARPVGKASYSYISIPEKGEHIISFLSAVPLLIRVLALEQHDFLFPKTQLNLDRRKGWFRDASQHKKHLSTHLRLEQKAYSWGRNNHIYEGALRGLELMEQNAYKEPFFPEFRTRARNYRFQHTFYRELLPKTLATAIAPLSHSTFFSRVLLTPGQRRKEVHVYPQLLIDHMRLLSQGTFATLPAGGEKLRYPLPPRFTTSTLRVALDTSNVSEKVLRLYVQFDDLPAQRLYVLPQYALDSSRFRKTLVEGVLEVLEKDKQPKHLINTSIAELALPVGTKNVSIWMDGRASVSSSVAYRATKNYQLSKNALSEYQNILKEDWSVLSHIDTINKPIESIDDSHIVSPNQEITNHYIPFLRYLKSRRDSLIAKSGYGAIECTMEENTDEEKDMDLHICKHTDLLETAIRLEQRDPLESLRLYNKLTLLNDIVCKNAGIRGRHALLIKLGDIHLAESLLKDELISKCSGNVALSALEQLHAAKTAKTQSDLTPLTDIYAAKVALTPTVSNLSKLSQMLSLSGNTEFALLAENLIELRKKHISRVEFEHASVKPDKNTNLIVDASNLIKNASGGALAYLPALNTFSRYFRASPTQALELDVNGPATLEIETRQLHASLTSPAPDEVLVIEGENLKTRIPLINSRPTPGLKLIGISDILGTAQRQLVIIPPGTQEIRILPTNRDVFIRVFALKNNHSLPKASKENEELLVQFNELLVQAILDPRLILKSLAAIETLIQINPTFERIQFYRNWFNQHTAWRKLESVRDSAGVRILNVLQKKSAESLGARVREALLPPLLPQESRAGRTQELIFSLKNSERERLEITLFREDIGKPDLAPLVVELMQNGLPTKHVELGPRTSQTIYINSQEGQYLLRLRLKNALANQYIRLRIPETDKLESSNQLIQRQYFIATKNQPLRVDVNGPGVLRVDKVLNATIETEYKSLSPGVNEFSFSPDKPDKPDNGEHESLFRLFIRETITPQIQKSRPIFAAKSSTQPIPITQLPKNKKEDSHSTSTVNALREDFELGAQEDSTLSFRTGLVRRTFFEENSNKDVEQYLEVGAMHRAFFEHDRTYFTSDVALRLHENHEPSFGVREFVDWYPGHRDVALGFQGSSFFQFAKKDMAFSSRDLEWRTAALLNVRQERILGTKSLHVPRLELFGQLMSQTRDAPFSPESIDRDIYTEFKAEHRYGLKLSETFVYKPWRDNQTLLQASLRTNEDFNVTKPDNVSIRTGFRQLIGDFEMGLFYKGHYFLSDKNRQSKSIRHVLELGLDVSSWELLPKRLGFGSNLRYDLEHEEISASVFFHIDISAGRMYKDIRPVDYHFGDLRRYKARLKHAVKFQGR